MNKACQVGANSGKGVVPELEAHSTRLVPDAILANRSLMSPATVNDLEKEPA